MKFQKSNKVVAAGVAVAVLAGLGTALALESGDSSPDRPVMMGVDGGQQMPLDSMRQDQMPPDGMRGGRDGRGMGGPFARLDIVATTLGLTEDEVRAAVEGGTTLAELAEANDSSAQELIDALVAEVKAHFDAEVASGEHTQADADARLAEATTAITEFVDNTQEAMRKGPGGFGRHGGDHDDDGDHGPMSDDDMGGMGAGTGGGPIDGGPADATTTTAAG